MSKILLDALVTFHTFVTSVIKDLEIEWILEDTTVYTQNMNAMIVKTVIRVTDI